MIYKHKIGERFVDDKRDITLIDFEIRVKIMKKNRHTYKRTIQ